MRKMTLLSLDNKVGGLHAPITYGLWENGWQVSVLCQNEELDFNGSEFVMSYGPMQIMSPLIRRLTQHKNVPPLIFWQTEQVPKPNTPMIALHILSQYRYLLSQYVDQIEPGNRYYKMVKYLRVGGRYRIIGELCALRSLKILTMVGVFSETNASVLKKLGIPFSKVPMGGHRLWGRDLSLERDIDVIFLGSTRDVRRSRLIHHFEQVFRQKGINFIIRDGSTKHGYVFGDGRIELLNRAKIMLGIMRQSWDDNVFRFILAALNGCLLVSEKLIPSSCGPLRDQENCALVDLDRIPDQVEWYLNQNTKRELICQQAQTLITTQMTMTNMVQQLLSSAGIN